VFTVFQPNLVPRCALHHLSVYQIKRQSDYTFSPYGNFNTLTKRRKKSKKLRQFWKNISWKCLVRFCYNLECGILTVEGVSTAKIIWFRKSSTRVRMWTLHYCSSCQYTHRVARWLLRLHNTLPCILKMPTLCSAIGIMFKFCHLYKFSG